MFRSELAAILGLPETALTELPIGYSAREDCWTFPETDAAGQVVGICRRYRSGAKKHMSGGKRGLTIPSSWRDREGPVFLVEGPSDVLTLTAMGLSAVGRPSNTGGIELLASLLACLPAFLPSVPSLWPSCSAACVTTESTWR